MLIRWRKGLCEEKLTKKKRHHVKEHIIFLLQVRDAGNLLTRAGFTLPGVDVDEYTVQYSSGKCYASCFGSNLVFEQTAWQEPPVHCMNPSLDIN